MKKKIALLLATVMALSIMPVTIFAGSSNYLEKGTLTLKKDTRYDGTDGTFIPPSTSAVGNKVSNALVLEMKERTPSYEQKFRIQLTNAKFSNIVSFNGGEDARGVDVTGILSAGAFMDPGSMFDGTAVTRGNMWRDTIKINGLAPSAGAFDIQLDAGTDDIATVTITTAAAYTSSGKISIPLPIETDDISDADISVTIVDNNSLVSTGTYLISRTTGSATNTTVKEIKTGRELINVADVIIKEKLVGSFKSLQTARAFELVAPSGYEFVGLSSAAVTGTGEFSGLALGAIVATRDSSSVVIGTNGSLVGGSGQSTTLPEAIVVSGLKVQPIDNDVVSFGDVLQMGVYKYSGNLISGYTPLEGLTEQTFDAIKPVDWTVSVTAATAKDVVTGRYDASRADVNEQVAAKVTFKELEKSAWTSERTTDFTLPEGVSIRAVKFDTWSSSTIQQGNPAGSMTNAPRVDRDKWTLSALRSGGTGTATADGVVTIDKNVLSLKGIQVVSGKKAEIAFTLYLSVSPEFKGDKITLQTTGTAIPQEVPEVVIANCIQPITVTAKVTDVQIGFQKYAVGDITIKENKAGAILRNANAPVAEEGLILSIEDYISSDVTIVPIKESQVSVEGDLKVSLRKNTAGRVAFDVDRLSTKASTITIKGVEIKIDRTVPYGVYDLVVAGQSVFANEALTTAVAPNPVIINALHDDYGYTTPYINVATEGMNSPLRSNVKIAKDSDVAIVDGVQQQMMYPTYFDVSQGSFLVPARFISQIFGVEDNNIFWNNDTKTVTIITANRTLQFTAGSNIMLLAANGASSGVTMTAKSILHPVSERLYVPFRAIGDAFGVSVDYDEATGMAEYNKVK